MKKICAALLLASLCLSFISCSTGAPNIAEATGRSTTTPDPAFHVEVSQLVLPDFDKEALHFAMLDTDGTRILYSLNRLISLPEQMLSYYITEQVSVSDAITGETLCTWIPNNAGYYYAGALDSGNAAVLVGEHDFTNPSPQEHAVYCFGDNQTQVFPPVLEVSYFQRLSDNSVIFSFADSQGKTGVCQVKNGTCNEVLVMDTDAGKVPYAGAVSSYGMCFSHVMGQNNLLTLTVADPSDIQAQHTLAYQTEKMDSCCLTERGLLACLSVNEGTTDAHRSLVLYTDQGKALQLERAADSALYRMRFGKTAGIAVNSKWQLYLVGIGSDHIACSALQSITNVLDEHAKTRVSVFSAGDGKIVLFFSKTSALFSLNILYE